MQLKQYAAALCVMAVMVAITPATVRAQSSDLSSMLELLQSLMKQVETLQAQLAVLKGEIQDEIRAGLAEGMEDDDIKKIQELLATDPSIYPRGIVSGYYGPLTTEAIKKFQERHGLTVTGVVDEKTRELMQEYMKERQNGKFPPGLLKAPGISKKVMDRMREDDDGKKYLDCDDKRGAGPLCKNRDDDDDDDDDRPAKMVSTTAAMAIEAAEDAIDDLEKALASSSASTTDEDVIDEAEDELEDAKEKLADAEDEYEDGDYRDAHAKAVEAERIADRALDELLEDDDDDDDEDDEDN
jgi:hypothetical protein